MFVSGWRQWLKRQFQALQGRSGRGRRRRRDDFSQRYRPRLEYLEDRLAPAVLPPAGLVSWYRAEGNASDFAGGNDGVLMNGATFAIGEVGQAFSLDGVDDHVSFPTTSFLDIPTLEMWIRTTIPSQAIIDSGPTFGSWRIGIDSSGRATYAHFRNGTGGFVIITSLTDVADGQNHHLVAQTDQATKTIRLFVDGNLEASYTETDPSFTSWAFAASGDAKLGKSDTPGLPLSFYNGAADELTLYSRVLSSSEIQGLFNAGSEGKANIVVTTAVDEDNGSPDPALGTGTSLREALNFANTNPGRDVIGFNIPGGGVHTITPTSQLPTISDPLVIDGYTQPGASQNTDPNGFNGTLLIELDGTNAGGTSGLRISAGTSTVRGLVINRFILPSGSTDDTQGSGILLEGSGGNLIEGNFLGTDPTGTLASPNQNAGIFVASPSNTVGGTTAAARNVISGNAPFDGVFVSPANGIGDASANVIQGNFIGMQADGVSPLGNVRNGVTFAHGAHDNVVGGLAAGAGNRIAFNSVGIVGGTAGLGFPDTSGNSFLGNSIFSNTGLGIDFGGDGVTQNDVGTGDSDTGANNLQNFPDLTFAGLGPTSTTVTGTLDSAANTTFTLEFFANAQADPSGFGEGQTFLGSGTVDTDGSGHGSFTVTNLAAAPSGQTIITATATDPAGNTSEFSQALTGTVVAGPATHFSIAARATVAPGSAFSITVTALDANNNVAIGYTGTIHFSSSDPDPNIVLPPDFPFSAADAGQHRFGGGVTLRTTGTQTITATDKSNSTIIGSAAVLVAPAGATATTFVVINTLDSGPGSLRQAILDSNAHPGTDTITFKIGLGGPRTISVGNSGLGALPAVIDAVIIDGTTQPGFLGKPLIELEGSQAGVGVISGLVITAGNSTVKGLAINSFSGSGVLLDQAGGDVIVGNFLGTDLTGFAAKGNGVAGVEIVAGVNDTIGGTTPGARNLISGNVGGRGVLLDAGAARTIVAGNFIGTDMKGTHSLANNTGVEVHSTGAVIGGTTLAARNVISGNNGEGILLRSVASILGNFIGTDVSGTKALGNGVGIELAAAGTTIGGTAKGARNVISGNLTVGIDITADSTVVQGNFIGADVLGTHAVGNLGSGIVVTGGSNNLIGGSLPAARNLISGNMADGIRFFSLGGIDPTGNLVQGNLIGPDVTGARSLGSQQNGVAIFDGFQTTVGGLSAASRNIISGNVASGVLIGGPLTHDNLVQGNFIGIGLMGKKLANNNGVEITSGGRNVIGGTSAGARNVISGNTSDGVFIHAGASANLVEGNFIGTDLSGTAPLPNDVGVFLDSDGNTVGGTTPGAGNVISGNSKGVLIDFLGTGNVIEGNFIGTNRTGTAALANGDGIDIFGGSGNTIGGTVAGAGNVISGNTSDGVMVGGDDNQVQGNFIGTNSTGKTALANALGILITGGSNNTIGGATVAARNIISGNGTGVVVTAGPGTQVLGNFIGTDVSGAVPLANRQMGVEIDHSTQTTIGGTTPGAANIISGNGIDGVRILEGSDNQVLGNLIGTDLSGTKALANGGTFRNGQVVGSGVVIVSSSGNTIGGTTPGWGNVISGNAKDGVLISGGSANQVLGNFIGTDITGALALPNGTSLSSGPVGSGVEIGGGGQSNQIGGPSAAERNIISGNMTSGVHLTSSGTSGNLIQGNFIGTDVSGASALSNGLVNPRGVLVDAAAHDNVIGGDTPGAGNLISGNSGSSGGVGVLIFGDGNLLQGNLIGTDFSGAHSLPNAKGVSISAGNNNTVGGATAGAGNVISGNSQGGLDIVVSVFGGLGGRGNLVQGNFIGTDVSGTQAVPNGLHGISLHASSNTIGGTTAGAGNVISGNAGAGIEVNFQAGNLLQGNFIGTDLSGAFAVPNSGGGIVLNGARSAVIGGTMPGAANVISGNAQDGILVSGSGSGNQVQGNLIGTDVTGNFALPNAGNGVQIAAGANGNTIGGASSDAGNVISGNGAEGVLITGTGTKNNQVLGNFIGTDPSGTFAVANHRSGVRIERGASSNIIGGAVAGAGNVLSGNGFDGVTVVDSGTATNQILGNFIGTDVTGTFAIANTARGVFLLAGPTNNIIGGATPGSGNVISGNASDGISISGTSTGSTNNQILGNLIGTDVSGTFAVANGGNGVIILSGNTNTVGGTAAGCGNVISGNGGSGVRIDTTANQVLGNLIGTDVSGTSALANGGDGVVIFGPANAIGGTASGARNVISGNTNGGIFILADKTLVQGNFIGTDVAGSTALPNGQFGVELFSGLAHNTTIGGTAQGAGNVISGNAGDGVTISGNFATNTVLNNVVQGNFVGTDVSGAIALGNAGNGVRITGKASGNAIGGTARGASNIIAFNGLAGVLVDSGIRNRISGNSIFANAGLGIDLNPDPVVKANNLQTAPQLTSAVFNAAGTAITIKGTLTSTANTTFILEFFASPAGDPEGKVFLGFMTVTTSSSTGKVTFTAPPFTSATLSLGDLITATATDPLGNTSEFSNAVVVS